MDRKQYFEELHIALTREGFTSQPEQDELLPVEWDGLPLCRITADGGPMLSQPALETLAIVAYFQPVTRAYICLLYTSNSASRKRN